MQKLRVDLDQPTIGILIMRYLLSMVWLSQAAAKIFFRSGVANDDHNGFLGNLLYMRDTNPVRFIVSILDKFLIPNYTIILVLVILTELTIGTSLFLGLLTRFGSAIGGLMTISLFLLTLGWGEWIWTYPLIFFPHVLFFLAHSGKKFGLDHLLLERNKLISLKILM